VLLDGQGADELLAGYQFYFRQRQLDLLDQGRSALAGRETAKFNRRLKFASTQFEGSERRFNSSIAYSLKEMKSMEKSRPPVFSYPYSVGVIESKPGFRLRRTLSEALLYNSLPMLLRYADRNSMAFSREARLPYLDYDLVDFCISLPDDMYVRNGWQKWVLREAAGNSIPEKIRWRADKVGYAAPLDLWLRSEIREWGYDRVMDSNLIEIPGYDREVIGKLWNDHQQGLANNSWALWRWISMSEWLSLYRSGWWRSGGSSPSMIY
jgi:asparagine synthase (glutamine-hydrolysing)